MDEEFEAGNITASMTSTHNNFLSSFPIQKASIEQLKAFQDVEISDLSEEQNLKLLSLQSQYMQSQLLFPNNESKIENEIQEDEGEIDEEMNEEVQENPMSNIQENHKKGKLVNLILEKNGLMRFPLAKIKNIIKLDNDMKLCQKNAYIVVGKLTELFLQELAQNSHSVCKINKRKTMNIEDISKIIYLNIVCAIKSVEKYSFLDFTTIFNIETIEQLKAKEEKFEKKLKKTENLKTDKPNNTNIDNDNSNLKNNTNKKANKKFNDAKSNFKIDQLFSKVDK